MKFVEAFLATVVLASIAIILAAVVICLFS
jgi:hypothetical protein